MFAGWGPCGASLMPARPCACQALLVHGVRKGEPPGACPPSPFQGWGPICQVPISSEHLSPAQPLHIRCHCALAPLQLDRGTKALGVTTVSPCACSLKGCGESLAPGCHLPPVRRGLQTVQSWRTIVFLFLSVRAPIPAFCCSFHTCR